MAASRPVDELAAVFWILFSCGFGLYWFRYLKPQMVRKTKDGKSHEAAIGESGQVIKAPVENGRGVVRFTTPILGNDEWDFSCEVQVRFGDRVVIKEFSGNALIVTKR